MNRSARHVEIRGDLNNQSCDWLMQFCLVYLFVCFIFVVQHNREPFFFQRPNIVPIHHSTTKGLLHTECLDRIMTLCLFPPVCVCVCVNTYIFKAKPFCQTTFF